MTRLILATNNRHKVGELAAMFSRARFAGVRRLEVLGLADLAAYGSAPEIEETEVTFEGNAILKANGIAAWLRMHAALHDDLVLADDSGLCVDALEGRPGVYSARYAGPDGNDDDNNAKLVGELRELGLDRSGAEYVCVLALRTVGERPFEFTLPETESVRMIESCLCIEGRCRGNIRIERHGDGGFGYDPYFWIDDDARTFADLSEAEKAQRSHRGAAMRRLIQELPLLV